MSDNVRAERDDVDWPDEDGEYGVVLTGGGLSWPHSTAWFTGSEEADAFIAKVNGPDLSELTAAVDHLRRMTEMVPAPRAGKTAASKAVFAAAIALVERHR
jgi:hypothetical protein